MKKIIIDKPVFITSISTLLLIFSVFMLFPSESNVLAQKLFEEILNNLGFLYTWSGVLVICGIAISHFHIMVKLF